MREALLHEAPRGGGTLRGARGVVEHGFDAAREGGGVFGRHENARLLVRDHLRDAPHRARHGGHPRREGLEQ